MTEGDYFALFGSNGVSAGILYHFGTMLEIQNERENCNKYMLRKHKD